MRSYCVVDGGCTAVAVRGNFGCEGIKAGGGIDKPRRIGYICSCLTASDYGQKI